MNLQKEIEKTSIYKSVWQLQHVLFPFEEEHFEFSYSIISLQDNVNISAYSNCG